MSLGERLRRLDDRVLPRMLGGPARPGDDRSAEEFEVARWRFLTFLNGFLTLLQGSVLLFDGYTALRLLLVVCFGVSAAYNRVLWVRALAKVERG